MSSEEKMIARIKSLPRDYTYSEARTLTGKFGYAEQSKGRTSGSRISFFRETDGRKIMLHKPHPGNILKHYAVKQLLEQLIENGDIDG